MTPFCLHMFLPHPLLLLLLLKDDLVHSHFTNNMPISNPVQPLTIPCGACDCCEYLNIRHRAVLPGREKWHQKKAVTCSPMGIIYLLQCPCGVFYVGKTHIPFVRISEHMSAAKSGYFKTVIGYHIAFSHSYFR